VEWNEVKLDLRNGIIQGYRVLLTDHDHQENTSNVILNGSTLSIEFNNLLPFHAYDVSIRAFNRKGDGPASKYKAFTGEKGNKSSTLCMVSLRMTTATILVCETVKPSFQFTPSPSPGQCWVSQIFYS